MSKLSLKLQTKSLKEMENREEFEKTLAGFKYFVLPKVYKGSTDTELFCSLLNNIKTTDEVWDIGTDTGLIAMTAKRNGAKYVLATDLNSNAVLNAKKNAKVLGLDIDVRQADVFGDIKKKFDLITFNPPFTDNKAIKEHDISFWDNEHKTLNSFLKNLKDHLKDNGRAMIAWSSFAKISTLKKIGAKYGYQMEEIGKRKGKMGFIYYVFEIKYHFSSKMLK